MLHHLPRPRVRRPTSRPSHDGRAASFTVGESVRSLSARDTLLSSCGTGFEDAPCPLCGCTRAGVEPQALSAARARGEHRLDVFTGRFGDVRLPEGSLDAIAFSGVLEHLHDPVAARRRARALPAPGGLIAVPFLPMLDSPGARSLGPR